jgi:hypothetical protein
MTEGRICFARVLTQGRSATLKGGMVGDPALPMKMFIGRFSRRGPSTGLTLLAGWTTCAVTGIAGCTRAPQSTETRYTVDSWRDDGHLGRRIATEHYEIFSTVDDREFERALPVFLETAYKQYERTIPNNVVLDAPLSTFVFQSRQEWAAFSRRRFPQRFPVYSLIRSGGFTDGTNSVLFYVDRASTFATLAHEGWHQYAATRFGQLPAWLNEGLACSFETYRWAGKEVVFESLKNTFRLNSLREAVQTGSLITLRELLATHAGQVVSLDDSRITQSYYAQAWAFVCFLRYGDEGRWAAGFERLLHDMAQGEFRLRLGAQQIADARVGADDPGAALIRLYFGVSAEELEECFRVYLLALARFDNP